MLVGRVEIAGERVPAAPVNGPAPMDAPLLAAAAGALDVPRLVRGPAKEPGVGLARAVEVKARAPGPFALRVRMVAGPVPNPPTPC